MQPNDEFWSGVGRGVASADGWMVVLALTVVVLVVGVLIVYAKYINPSHERLKARELDIREREVHNDEERIKTNAALAENMRGLQESYDRMAQRDAEMTAGIEESKNRSREMGRDVNHIKLTADHMAEKIDELHTRAFRERTD